MRPRITAWVILAWALALSLAGTAWADGTLHKLTWKHFDGANAAQAELKLDGAKLGVGQPAVDALYQKIAAMPQGDQIAVKQGVLTGAGIRQFPLNLSKLIAYAQRYGVVVNVPPNNAP